MIIRDRRFQGVALGAFGYTAIDPNSLSLPDVSVIMGGIDIFSDDVYKLTGQDGNPHHGHRHRDGPLPSFNALWGSLQSIINSALSSVDAKDPLAGPMVSAIKKYLGKMSSAIESSKKAMQAQGDDQSKSLRATNLNIVFDTMNAAVAALPAIVAKAQAAVQQRAEDASAAAQAQAQAAAQKQASDAAAASAAAQTAAAAQATQLLQAQDTQAKTFVQVSPDLVAASNQQKSQNVAEGAHILGIPVPYIVTAAGVLAVGGAGYWGYRKFKNRKRSA